MKSLLSTILLFEMFVFGFTHLLPEDSQTDTEELLNREKREDFLNSILKSFPFFNEKPTRSSLKDEDDPNEDTDEDEIQSTSSIKVFKTLALNSSSRMSHLSTYIVSATIIPTPTKILKTSTNTVIISKTPALTSTPVLVSRGAIATSTKSSFLLTPTVISTSSKTLISASLATTIKNTQLLGTMQSSISVSSRVIVMPRSSLNKKPSPTRNMLLVRSSVFEEMQPIIKMMILSSDDRIQNGPKLPDELGYADTIGRAANSENTEYRSIRYLYSNVLIPVMSGLCGALLITFGIILYKCIRRRRLQKIRYYGGKPNSALYRLDEMSLLSELTSDEED